MAAKVPPIIVQIIADPLWVLSFRCQYEDLGHTDEHYGECEAS
eukprot:SAG31_NODE_6488_length_1999_cov_1.372105_3_plen_43_part_00